MKIKRGNSIALVFLIKDSNGDAMQNLSAATAIKFMVKINSTDDNLDAVISKSLSDGIVVDDPWIGYVNVSLTSVDTTIAAGQYFVALQIEWATSIQEINIKEGVHNIVESNTLYVTEDVIR